MVVFTGDPPVAVKFPSHTHRAEYGLPNTAELPPTMGASESGVSRNLRLSITAHLPDTFHTPAGGLTRGEGSIGNIDWAGERIDTGAGGETQRPGRRLESIWYDNNTGRVAFKLNSQTGSRIEELALGAVIEGRAWQASRGRGKGNPTGGFYYGGTCADVKGHLRLGCAAIDTLAFVPSNFPGAHFPFPVHLVYSQS
ncbi:hypothetical protein Bbelb_424610 [Branchiostoma belcheri]|nr:hypothetical protein Bbelb_424610 [Branchiostoma belcheri]